MRFWLALMLLLVPAQARETCKAPNVPRAVLILGHTVKNADLICPPVGLCFRVAAGPESGSVGAVAVWCLSPEENEAAESRGRMAEYGPEK